MKRALGFLLAIIIIGIFSVPILAQDLRVTAFAVKNEEGNSGAYYGGKLFITVKGQEKMIAEQANDVWLINGGREVVYSARDGAGGYENEGQSLHLYELKTGKTRKILSQYFMVTGLSEVKLKNGQIALLVRLEDGGLGASYFSVVDPKRGEVFFRSGAEISSLKAERIKLSFYKENDWETINQDRDSSFYDHKSAFLPKKTKVKPHKTQSYDLKQILKNKVIYNKSTNEILDAGLKTVKLYFWRFNDEQPNKNFVLGTVERQVESASPLSQTLEELFRGTTKDEEEKGFGSSTFGMKFEGVILKDSVATVKFSQPPNETNYGTLGSFIFLDAIEKTAKQFPTVKKVKVCAIGQTLIDAQLEEQFPRCK
jgi:spore germination protein GerM